MVASRLNLFLPFLFFFQHGKLSLKVHVRRFTCAQYKKINFTDCIPGDKKGVRLALKSPHGYTVFFFNRNYGRNRNLLRYGEMGRENTIYYLYGTVKWGRENTIYREYGYRMSVRFTNTWVYGTYVYPYGIRHTACDLG